MKSLHYKCTAEPLDDGVPNRIVDTVDGHSRKEAEVVFFLKHGRKPAHVLKVPVKEAAGSAVGAVGAVGEVDQQLESVKLHLLRKHLPRFFDEIHVVGAREFGGVWMRANVKAVEAAQACGVDYTNPTMKRLLSKVVYDSLRLGSEDAQVKSAVVAETSNGH